MNLMNSFKSLSLLFLFIGMTNADPIYVQDCSDLPENNIWLNGNEILYKVSSQISGFSFID